MGQKVNPIGIRLGIVKDWDSKWYASSKNYSEYLLSDIAVRDFLFKEFFIRKMYASYILFQTICFLIN